MTIHSVEAQKQTLQSIQQFQAGIMFGNGVAQLAFKERNDEDLFSDATNTKAAAESKPVVMRDASDPGIERLYIFLQRGEKAGRLIGEEINVGMIKHSSDGPEIVKPEGHFTIDQVLSVRALSEVLLARKETDLPNLSDDLLGITDPLPIV